MSTEKGQKMTLKMSTEGNKIPFNFVTFPISSVTPNFFLFFHSDFECLEVGGVENPTPLNLYIQPATKRVEIALQCMMAIKLNLFFCRTRSRVKES